MLRVIGAGFGRTGTHSLAKALEKLGFGPCYNLLEVAKNPGHTEIWNKAVDGIPVDWDWLFNSYQSTVEWPSIAFLDELIQQFSQAKVVLTLRDPESWYESADATIFTGLELSAKNPNLLKRQKSSMQRRLILEHTFANRYREKEYALEVYRRHNQRVEKIIPEERLLKYRIQDGWVPLCEFLNKPIPAEAFPWLNDRAGFLDSAPKWAKR